MIKYEFAEITEETSKARMPILYQRELLSLLPDTANRGEAVRAGDEYLAWMLKHQLLLFRRQLHVFWELKRGNQLKLGVKWLNLVLGLLSVYKTPESSALFDILEDKGYTGSKPQRSKAFALAREMIVEWIWKTEFMGEDS